MDFPQRAVFFLEEDSSLPAHSKPLMLEAVLFCPILKWMSDKLLADGVQRFFAVSSPRFAQEVRACFPEDADVTISEQHSELLDFLNTPDPVAVFVRAALPMEEAGPGFVYGAVGYELQAVWQEKMTNAVSAAELIPGWVPVFSLETVAELEPLLRERIVRRHIRAGVRVLDPNAVYIDPRVTIGRGTMLLPGTILRGETAVGCGCTIGPNSYLENAKIGDDTNVNSSQVYNSTVGYDTHIGPFAYIRPGSTIGSHIRVGDFVEIKNSTIADGTKISHLTYVGDSDVGQNCNFGCGVTTANFDRVQKHETVVGEGAFIGCNTALIAPLQVGSGAYIGAGSTITEDVPAQALGIARALGIGLEDACRALGTAAGVKGRIEVVPTPGRDYTVLIDYAHTPDGLENILRSVRDFCRGRLIVLFGCGGDRDRTKRPIMGEIAARLADVLVVTSDNPRTEEPMAIIREILAGIPQTEKPVYVEENRRRAIRMTLRFAQKDDMIVLAGKGHETYQVLGTEKIHFDEREEVAACLQEEDHEQ